jgi:uncharacterized membrane protein YidH (DUF202 family)
VREEEVILTMMSMLILAGVAVLALAMWNRRKLREMEHRERLAMIEHGLVPAPETDPFAFEARTGLAGEPESRFASRSRTGGIFLIGLGLALMVMLTFAGGSPGIGIGIGGAFAVVGAAFLFNAMLPPPREPWRPHTPASAPRRPGPPASPAGARHDPPPNIAP